LGALRLVSKIETNENESQKFNPLNHFSTRIKEMENTSNYGAEVASKWKKVLNHLDMTYPVVHPIGKETFSIYAEFPNGIFEYAMDIDGATSLINEKSIKALIYSPPNIIESVDSGNINRDPNQIRPNHKNPVMVIQSHYLTNNKPYCINGNHRIFESYRNGDDQIEVYFFNDLEFVPFFYDTLSKATYFLEIDYYNVASPNSRHLQRGKAAYVDELYKM